MAELLVDRAEVLRRFVRKAMQRKFASGEFDCGLLIADWIDEIHGVDPGVKWRGQYASPRDAEKIVREAGGIEALLAHALEPLEFRCTDTPSLGDVGIVRDDAGQLVMAIRGEGEWIGRCTHGVICQDFPMIAAWRV